MPNTGPLQLRFQDRHLSGPVVDAEDFTCWNLLYDVDGNEVDITALRFYMEYATKQNVTSIIRSAWKHNQFIVDFSGDVGRLAIF